MLARHPNEPFSRRRVTASVLATALLVAGIPADLARAETETQSKPDTPAIVVPKPPAWTQVKKSAQERGANPCDTPDPGLGAYEPWNREPSIGQMLVPRRKRKTYDVMIHFHGHEPVRKEWVRVMDSAILVGIDLGSGSGPYEETFETPDTFRTLVQSIERAVEKRHARVQRIGLSAWSAGYGAIQKILAVPEHRKRVDSVVLLDALHCGYSGASLNEPQLRPFMAFSQEAARRQKLMVVTHSSIIPPGYASTTETANYLVYTLGGKPRRARPRPSDPLGLELISRYSQGAFHVRGFSGNDKLDHCAHLGLYSDVLKVHVRPRWRSFSGAR